MNNTTFPQAKQDVYSVLSQALAYHSMDWNVLPIFHPDDSNDTSEPGKRGKKAMVKWKDIPPPDVRQIEEWWGRWPNANIALLTGKASGVVVVDDDSYKTDDGELAALEAIYGKLPETATCLSGGGGKHYFFEYPANVRIGKPDGVVAPHIDIRGDGGYLILAPSIHERGTYEWDLGKDPTDGCKLARLPLAWITLLSMLSSDDVIEKKHAKIVAKLDIPVDDNSKRDCNVCCDLVRGGV